MTCDRFHPKNPARHRCGCAWRQCARIDAAPALAQTAVSLQLSWLHSSQFAGSYIALDRGWWSEAGLDVSLLPGGPNAPVEPPVVSGTALVGISAADYTAAAVEQGAPFKILGVAMQKNPFVIASLPATR
jgi:ABC-type nitrate/sulfonate/bicarbonate transport system substrate-binding protein